MSRCAHLVFVLSAACGGPSNHTQPPPSFVGKVSVTPAPPVQPVESPAPVVPEPTPPVEAPAIPEPPTTPVAVEPAPKPKMKCNPMSRAGCRWDEDTDERELRRLQQKKARCERPTRAACDWDAKDEAALQRLTKKQPVQK